jgi:hypothetical protein
MFPVGGMKVSEGSTIVLCTDGDAMVLDECRHQWYIDVERNSQHDIAMVLDEQQHQWFIDVEGSSQHDITMVLDEHQHQWFIDVEGNSHHDLFLHMVET